MTGTLVAGIISTTEITTGKLNVTDGCTIGAWKVTKEGLVATGDTKTSIQFNISNSDYLRIRNDTGSTYMDMRRSVGSGINIYVSGQNADGISIQSSKGYALRTSGSHRFLQGINDKWNAPGLLWAGTIDIDGNLENQWGNGCTVSSTYRSGNGNYYIYHNLGTNAYFVYATVISDYCTAIVPYRYNNYFRVYIFNTNGTQVNAAFHVMIVGRNIVEQS